MESSDYKISLDLLRMSAPVSLSCRQGDTGRRICINLTQDGTPYNIAPGCYAVFAGKKPDDKVLWNGCTIEGNTIIYELTDQTLAVTGWVPVQILLYGNNGKRLASPDFVLLVDEPLVRDAAVVAESANEITALTQLIGEATDLIEEMEGFSDGASAYEIALENGFEGSEGEWLESLRGEQGPVGPAGATGSKGEKGDTGPQGPKGETGAQGAQGPAGSIGPQGPRGNTGATGADGGYYTPKMSQPTDDTMQVSFTPSKEGMPSVAPVTVNLPVGSGNNSSPNVNQGMGWTTEQINLLDELFNHVHFNSAEGGTIADNLIASLRSGSSGNTGGEEEPDTPVEPDEPVVALESISAVYSGGDVAVGTAVTDLTGIVVTATYSDGNTATVTDYTLSGEIAEGSNTVTVSYEGKTTTFAVTGIAESEPDESEVIELPDGYTQLAYISNNNAAGFDTGITPTANTNAEYKINLDTCDTYSRYILVSPTVDNLLYPQHYFPVATSYGWKANKMKTSNQNAAALGTPTTGVDYVASAFGSGNQVTVNGTTATVLIGATEVTEPLWLFGYKEQNTYYHMQGKMYYCKIWESDVLVRHFVPCSNPDGVIGMYDIVEGKFYQSESTTAFIGGDPV